MNSTHQVYTKLIFTLNTVLDQDLPPETAFSALALFNTLRFPVLLFMDFLADAQKG